MTARRLRLVAGTLLLVLLIASCDLLGGLLDAQSPTERVSSFIQSVTGTQDFEEIRTHFLPTTLMATVYDEQTWETFEFDDAFQPTFGPVTTGTGDGGVADGVVVESTLTTIGSYTATPVTFVLQPDPLNPANYLIRTVTVDGGFDIILRLQ